MIRALRALFSRNAPDPYCAVCDGYHPRSAVRYNGQHLCHYVSGSPLPYVSR